MGQKMRGDFETGCKFKMGHDTYADAIEQSRKRNAAMNLHKRLMPYKCPFCTKYHVGRKNGRGSTKLKPYSRGDRQYKQKY